MGQLYKVEYRRYGVQIPIPIADEIDQLVAENPLRSASQVIVDGLRRGYYGSGIHAPEQISIWQDTEIAMMRAVRMAIDALNGPMDKREQRLAELATFVIESGLRKSSEYQQQPARDLVAAEAGSGVNEDAPPTAATPDEMARLEMERRRPRRAPAAKAPAKGAAGPS